MTVAYITILDTFTPYDATYAVIRIVLIGFFMLGLLYMDRIKIMERLSFKKAHILKWFLPLTVFVIGSAAFGLAAPKSDPNWPDPVPFLKRSLIMIKCQLKKAKLGMGIMMNPLAVRFRKMIRRFLHGKAKTFLFQGRNEGYLYRQRMG